MKVLNKKHTEFFKTILTLYNLLGISLYLLFPGLQNHCTLNLHMMISSSRKRKVSGCHEWDTSSSDGEHRIKIQKEYYSYNTRKQLHRTHEKSVESDPVIFTNFIFNVLCYFEDWFLNQRYNLSLLNSFRCIHNFHDDDTNKINQVLCFIVSIKLKSLVL